MEKKIRETRPHNLLQLPFVILLCKDQHRLVLTDQMEDVTLKDMV